jgi:hypothetical protein
MDMLLQELYQINQPFQIMLSTSMEVIKIQLFYQLPLLNKTDTSHQGVPRSAIMSERMLVIGSMRKLQKQLLNGVTDNLKQALQLMTIRTLKDQLTLLPKEPGESLTNKSLLLMLKLETFQNFCNGVITTFQPNAKRLIANANFKL